MDLVLYRREKQVFERFTAYARRAVVLAQEEARMFDHHYIGTEHLLAGILREGESLAFQALDRSGVTLEGVRAQIERLVGRGQLPYPGDIPFTPRCKQVLELSLREMLQLGHTYIGPEHHLLAIIRKGDGVAVQILDELGVELSALRRTVTGLLGEPDVTGDESSEAEPRIESKAQSTHHLSDELREQIRSAHDGSRVVMAELSRELLELATELMAEARKRPF